MIAPIATRSAESRTARTARIARILKDRHRPQRERLTRSIEFDVDDSGWSDIARRLARGERIHGHAL
jgi:hypothetical protein